MRCLDRVWGQSSNLIFRRCRCFWHYFGSEAREREMSGCCCLLKRMMNEFPFPSIFYIFRFFFIFRLWSYIYWNSEILKRSWVVFLKCRLCVYINNIYRKREEKMDKGQAKWLRPGKNSHPLWFAPRGGQHVHAAYAIYVAFALLSNTFFLFLFWLLHDSWHYINCCFQL